MEPPQCYFSFCFQHLCPSEVLPSSGQRKGKFPPPPSSSPPQRKQCRPDLCCAWSCGSDTPQTLLEASECPSAGMPDPTQRLQEPENPDEQVHWQAWRNWQKLLRAWPEPPGPQKPSRAHYTFSSQVQIYNPAFFKYIHDRWTEHHGRYPSTGMLVLFFALHVCDEVGS